MLSCEEGCRSGSYDDANGGEASSSEESAGVMVCVNIGDGLFREDWEKPRVCLKADEVRKGRLRVLCKVVSNAVYARHGKNTHLVLIRKLLQVVLFLFTSTFAGSEHVCVYL